MDNLFTMLYWTAGIIIFIFILDWFWIKPYQEKIATERLLKLLKKEKDPIQPTYNLDKGIVMIVEDTTATNALLLFTILQHQQCQLPVTIYYQQGGLKDNHLELFKAFRVECVEIAEPCQHDQAKIYALVRSPYQQVLLIEPEMVFLRNPEHLFADPQYTQTGALFWRDQKLSSYWDHKVYDWVKKIISYRKGDNRILNKESGSHQTGDLLLIDKRSHSGTMQKLLTFAEEPDTIYAYLNGYKETFWISAELAKENYAFAPYPPGVIGELCRDTLCGYPLHFDPRGQPIGWSGDLSEVTHFATFEEGNKWGKLLMSSGQCLKGSTHKELSGDIKRLINEYSQYLHDLKQKYLL